MPANEFEGQVQQKIEGLKITPSAEVWQKVEAQIKKEKKRRVLFMLLSLFLLLFVGGLFWLNKNDKGLHASIKRGLDDSLISSSNINPEAIRKPENKNTDSATSQSTNRTPIIKPLERVDKIKTSKIFQLDNKYKFSQRNAEIGTGDVIDNSTKTKKAKVKIKVTEEDANVTTANKKENIQQDSTSISISKSNNLVKKVNQDSSIKAIPEIIKDTPKAKQNDLQVNKNKVKKNKWGFAVQLGLGMSATGNSLLGNNNNSYSYTVTTPTGPVLGGYGQYTPSAIKMSWAFKLGLSAMYHVSKRFAISAGLTYKLYSTVTVNERPDSLPGGGFIVRTNILYHNYYHFIDVPVEFQYRIGNNEKIPMYAFAGINLSQLIYTNAMQFDFTTGEYYHDNSLFYKTGVGLSAGFLIGMFQKQKMTLQVGPDFYYGLSNISHSGLYAGKHYSFIGLRFQKIIGKR